MSKGISRWPLIYFLLFCGTALTAQVRPIHSWFETAQMANELKVKVNCLSEDDAIVMMSYVIDVLEDGIALKEYKATGQFLSVPGLPTLLHTLSLPMTEVTKWTVALRITENERVIWEDKWQWKSQQFDQPLVEAATARQPNIGQQQPASISQQPIATTVDQPQKQAAISTHKPQTKNQEVIKERLASTINKQKEEEQRAKPIDLSARKEEIISTAQSTLASQVAGKTTKVDKVSSPFNEDAEIGGLIIDESRTKLGRDFYEQFFSKWIAPNGVGDSFIIKIEELPSFGRVSRISVVVNDQTVVTRSLSPGFGQLEANVNASIRGVRGYLSRRMQMSKDLENEDQKGSGIF